MKDSVVKICSLVLVGLSGSAQADVTGVEVNVEVVVATHDSPPPNDPWYYPEIERVHLYQPHVHVFGSETLLIPTDSRIADARFMTSETTLGTSRTIHLRLETLDSVAMADESVYFDLVQGDMGSVVFNFMGDIIDPDRIGDAIRTSRLLGTDDKILSEWDYQSSSPWMGAGHLYIDIASPFGTSFFGGTPVGFEVIYIYEIVGCQADLNGDGVLNFIDVSVFLTAFSEVNLAVDFNDDGILNFFDVSAFLQAFSSGCP